ncbi:STAS domain-containing protein [Indioceanicola profundi]|uniref:STAS domain-containing protein n=1 Tax=Indioceanicola profundi TaxID=2220096 RepID=UPI000E6AADC1|nr:STAS domain-containing protein [Indioceanicola profundi]
MDYSVQEIDGGIVVNFSGRMTLVDHDRFRSVIDSMEKMHGSRCIFDLAGLDFIDSSGLGMFLIARDIAMPRNVEIELRGATGSVRRVLQIAKFDTLFLVRD